MAGAASPYTFNPTSQHVLFFRLRNGSTPASTTLAVTRAGNMLVLTWQAGWILQAASSPNGPWNDVAGAASPYTFSPASQRVLFFRLRNGSTPPSPTLSIARSGHKLVLTWQSVSTLQSAPTLKGPWNDLPGAASPFTYDPASGPAQFFRLRN